MKNILINCIGIKDSGGITVLEKLLNEIKDSGYYYLIICNQNQNIENLVKRFTNYKNLEFKVIPSKGFLNRIYYENIIFRKIIKEKNIDLVYNFSGTSQYFLPKIQLTKVHNLLFYSKRLDFFYFKNKKHLDWLKQVFLKRIVFHSMLQQTKYIEIQSNHVKENISDFIDISNKNFFIKSDIEVNLDIFESPRQYDFTKKIRYLYIVGPHFSHLHKNFKDFVDIMKLLDKQKSSFEIVITLSKEQLHSSEFWDQSLDKKTFFLGYISKDEIKKQFQDNTILISTSIIETLGLHVIESIQQGVLVIVPNEKYSLDVYGNDILTYNLFNIESLYNIIQNIYLQDNNYIKDIILRNQKYLIDNEKTKYKNIENIFNKILKENNV
jgi:hypothetical protein